MLLAHKLVLVKWELLRGAMHPHNFKRGLKGWNARCVHYSIAGFGNCMK